MFMIGIDPHKRSHTAVVVDRDEMVIDTIRVDADRHQRQRLLEWAARYAPRTWAVEGATGMGAMLAQQLVAAGEHVVDVPPKLSSRVRLLERGRIDKTDPNDARSADLRHLHATQLLAAGVPVRTGSGRLGHANAATTLNVYAHFLEASDRDAAAVIGSLLQTKDEAGAQPADG